MPLERPPLDDPSIHHLPPTDDFNVNLQPDEDAIIKFPETRKRVGTTRIRGGRNIHIIGGEAISPGPVNENDSRVRAVLAFQELQGTAHIEGLLIQPGPEREQCDGIAFWDCPNGTIQIYKCRIVDMHGEFEDPGHGGSGLHSDVIQAMGTLGTLKVECLTASSDYQGLFFGTNARAPINIRLKDVEVWSNDRRGYMYWFNDSDAGHVTLSGCFVGSDDGYTRDKLIWDSSGVYRRLISLEPGGLGEFVPAGLVGLGYGVESLPTPELARARIVWEQPGDPVEEFDVRLNGDIVTVSGEFRHFDFGVVDPIYHIQLRASHQGRTSEWSGTYVFTVPVGGLEAPTITEVRMLRDDEAASPHDSPTG